MNFQQKRMPGLPNSYVWHCNRGRWSFLIIRDISDTLHFCSYKRGMSPATMFGETEEHTRLDKPAPEHFGFNTLKDAIRACEVKYKQLLLR